MDERKDNSGLSFELERKEIAWTLSRVLEIGVCISDFSQMPSDGYLERSDEEIRKEKTNMADRQIPLTEMREESRSIGIDNGKDRASGKRTVEISKEERSN